MKKIVITILGGSAIILVFGLSVFGADKTKIEKINEAVQNKQVANDPDGKVVKMTDKRYKANQNDEKVKQKKAEEMPGYVPDEVIEKEGGKYTKKELMTYGEYIELGTTDAIRHDIDPGRLVWVFESRFDKDHEVFGKTISKAIITTVYDAETGDSIEINVKSDEPNGVNFEMPVQDGPVSGGEPVFSSK